MKLLVTGGAGYIGSVATAQLLEAGHEVVVFDNLSTGSESAVPEGARLVAGDLLDVEGMKNVLAEGFDGVLHFAALSLDLLLRVRAGVHPRLSDGARDAAASR